MGCLPRSTCRKLLVGGKGRRLFGGEVRTLETKRDGTLETVPGSVVGRPKG